MDKSRKANLLKGVKNKGVQKKVVLNTKVTRDEEAITDSSNGETVELYDGEQSLTRCKKAQSRREREI